MTCCYDNVQSPEKGSVSFISLPAAACAHSSTRAFISPHKDHPEDISWAQGTEDLPRTVSFKLKEHYFEKILLEPRSSLYWNWGTKSITVFVEEGVQCCTSWDSAVFFFSSTTLISFPLHLSSPFPHQPPPPPQPQSHQGDHFCPRLCLKPCSFSLLPGDRLDLWRGQTLPRDSPETGAMHSSSITFHPPAPNPLPSPLLHSCTFWSLFILALSLSSTSTPPSFSSHFLASSSSFITEEHLGTPAQTHNTLSACWRPQLTQPTHYIISAPM